MFYVFIENRENIVKKLKSDVQSKTDELKSKGQKLKSKVQELKKQRNLTEKLNQKISVRLIFFFSFFFSLIQILHTSLIQLRPPPSSTMLPAKNFFHVKGLNFFSTFS